MMRNAFIDGNGVLQAYGSVSSNAPGQTSLPVADDFSLQIGQSYWDGAQWAQYLPYFRDAQIANIQGACQAAIFAGFTSSALGAAHTYPAKDRDQQNLSASVLASLMPGLAAGWVTPFWCADASGNWAYVNHTAAQIQQVGQDGKASVLAALAKCQTFIAQVMAATTVATVQAVVWT